MRSNPRAVGLAVLFGVLYFAQGIAEPTEGLIAQPVRTLLSSWQYPAAAIGQFAALIAIPWSLKPVFGLLTDFVPLFGLRRKTYLVLASGAAGSSLLWLATFPPPTGAYYWLLAGLLIPTIGVALADVVIDALMIETGRPLGQTGRLQSVQWGALYTATIATGSLGGWLSQWRLPTLGFLICGVTLLLTLPLAIWFVREERGSSPPGTAWQEVRGAWQVVTSPSLLTIAAFLLLWNFNPFSSAVLQSYMSVELGWEEQFYGHTITIQAVAAVVASVAYGMVCRQLGLARLVHLTILQGILATVGYWGLTTRTSAIVISMWVGFSYMTATLIQLDLAARLCPPRYSATVFATLMSVSNLGISLSYAAGGWLYDALGNPWGRLVAFRLLVGVGAATTAACWLLAPRLIRALQDAEADDYSSRNQPVA